MGGGAVVLNDDLEALHREVNAIDDVHAVGNVYALYHANSDSQDSILPPIHPLWPWPSQTLPLSSTAAAFAIEYDARPTAAALIVLYLPMSRHRCSLRAIRLTRANFKAIP